jgi:magnesium-transporting ATPase (P-type)
MLMRTEEAILVLESSPEGLLNEEALKRLDRYGPNILEEKNKVTPFKVLVRQLANVIVWVLAAAALIALLAGEVINFWAIIGIILFVIIMGFLQEYRLEIWNLWKKTLVGVTPALVLGGLFENAIEEYLFNPLTVAVTLLVG